MKVSVRGRGGPRGTARLGAAAAVAVVVGVLGVWAQNPALVGVNYDDGIYALVGKAVADGDGLTYDFLPERIPAVKYPPVYPISLAPFWSLARTRDAALRAMKIANGLYLGLAAGLFVVLVSASGALPLAGAVLVALLGFASGSMMLVTAGLLSEPLYLVFLFAALLSADAAAERTRRRRHVAAAALAALAALTRTVGLAAVVAVVVALWRRHGRGPALVAAVTAAIVMAPWLAFALANAGRVPDALVPRYGSYLQLYLANLSGSPGSALDIFATNTGAILQTLGGGLVPQLGPVAASLAGALLLVLAALGASRLRSLAPTTALYPWLYLAVVAVWSFPPFRFVFIVFPLLLALAAAGVRVAAERAGSALAGRSRAAAWARGAVIAGAALVAVNMGYRGVRALARRVWDGAELEKSASAAELVEWVRRSTGTGDVVAFELDPLVALYTGRRVVPNNYEPVHLWYRRDAPPIEPLARMLRRFGADYLAVRRDVPLAAEPIDRLIRRYPGALRLVYVGARGVLVFETDSAALAAGAADDGNEPRERAGGGVR